MPFPFGKAFTYNFYPLADDEFVNIASVTAPEAVYVSKTKPSDTDARAGSMADLVQTVSPNTWAATADAEGKAITIAAIDDPEPTSAQDRYTYWVSIVWKYAVGAQAQHVIRALPLERTRAWHKNITTAAADLESIWAAVDSYVSSTNQTNAIALAKAELRMDLEAAGFEWALIWRPDDLNTLVAYKAVSNLAYGLGPEPKWLELGAAWRSTYEAMRDSIKLEYDKYREGKPSGVERAAGVMRVIR
jgi:hypothetical protein